MVARILLIFAIFAIVIVILSVGRNLYLRSQRLRRRLQMSAIYTNITHELLTPLTVISASVDKLRDVAPSHTRDYDLMQLNIQRMVRLLQQILETNKSEAGELKLLVAQGIQTHKNGRYYIDDNYKGRGLCEERFFHYYALDGEKKERSYMVWTDRGVDFIKDLLESENLFGLK